MVYTIKQSRDSMADCTKMGGKSWAGEFIGVH